MTIASEGIFAISTTISQYYKSGLIRFLKTIPISIFIYILSLIFARMLVLLTSFCILYLCAYFIFGVHLSLPEILHILLGALLGLVFFSFLGLLINLANRKDGENKGLSNIIYFSLIFFNDLFYPLTSINPSFKFVIQFSPMTPIIHLVRGDYSMFTYLLLWITIVIVAYSLVLRVRQIKRTE
jgi:ABC-2 type transport system permease protein